MVGVAFFSKMLFSGSLCSSTSTTSILSSFCFCTGLSCFGFSSFCSERGKDFFQPLRSKGCSDTSSLLFDFGLISSLLGDFGSLFLERSFG